MSIDALITEVLTQARGIAEDVQRRTGVRMRTATVTSASPLRIRYDGEDDASVVTPRTVVRPRVGDRVVVAKTRGQATILGVLGAPVQPRVNVPTPSGWSPDSSDPVGYTIENGACHWTGVYTKVGTLAAGWTTVMYAPPEARPRDGDQFRTLPTSSGRMVLGKFHKSDGKIEIWIDESASGIFMHFSPFSYLV